jgi:hypothetical protein
LEYRPIFSASYSFSVKCRRYDQPPLLLFHGSASGVAIQTMLKTTRGIDFRAGHGGTGLLRRVECHRHRDRRRGGAGCGRPRRFVTMGDVPMQEGARQHVQGDQGNGDQIARRPDAILLTAPLPRVDKSYPPASRSPTSCSSRWDHAASLTRMSLRTSRPLTRAIIQ